MAWSQRTTRSASRYTRKRSFSDRIFHTVSASPRPKRPSTSRTRAAPPRARPDAVDEVPSLAGSFDLVLIDGFDARGSAGRLDSVPFYAACRERLGPGGFLSVNLLSRPRGGRTRGGEPPPTPGQRSSRTRQPCVADCTKRLS